MFRTLFRQPPLSFGRFLSPNPISLYNINPPPPLVGGAPFRGRSVALLLALPFHEPPKRVRVNLMNGFWSVPPPLFLPLSFPLKS